MLENYSGQLQTDHGTE